ncbi:MULTISPECIES: hypothetical protein [Solibacillus]|uniref:Uncharacterized protein n=1 Tax=Solibacillus faecavium TaxID=2762221 RepID=A0ABR8XYB2_9BACL|nr:hypothetical protein [Solibacillus faecavium]MBD8036927.1 hypothetical protein [Solibacillus faecavium]
MGTIFFLFLLYIVIFLAVKHGINYSYIGQLAKNKFPDDIEAKNTEVVEVVSDEEIESELEKQSDKN